MSFAANSMVKPFSMATNGCLIPGPSSTSRVAYAHPYLSIPYKTTIKFQLSCKSKSSISFPSAFSSAKAKPFFRVAVVAAALEENNPVILEEKEEEEEIEGNLNWDASESDENDAEGEESYVEPPEGAKVYVGNLPYEMDSERLAELFQQAGVVDIAEVIYDRQTDRSRGFGFVTMSTVEEAERAVEMFNRYDLSGRLLTVNIAAPRGTRPERPPPQAVPNGCKLYVGNLPWSADGDRLGEVFSQYGEVVSAQVISDRDTGRSRGFGFVVMSNESESNDAIANLDGQMLDGRPIRVNVAQERPRRGGF